MWLSMGRSRCGKDAGGFDGRERIKGDLVVCFRIQNIKRAFAASFQIQAHNFGLLKIREGTIHGFCETEYLVTNRTSHYHIRKTVNLNSCSSHPGGIHYTRSNIPHMNCNTNTLRKIIVSNDATYELKPHINQGVYVSRVVTKGTTMVNIFEATGSAQYIVSRWVNWSLNGRSD